LQRLFLKLKVMGYVKKGEVVLRVPMPEQMRDDLRSIAALDGIPMKAWIAMVLNTALAARSDELKELKARRSKLKPPVTS
jgi:hypothetical protein